MKLSELELIEIMAAASNRLHRSLSNAYASGKLKEYLEQIQMSDLYPTKTEKDEAEDMTYPDGKIIIFGQSSVKPNEIYKIMESMNISKERIELQLGYDELVNFKFKKLHYNQSYRLILCGPMPHSTAGKGDSSSVIAEMENQSGYARVIRLTTSDGTLKISKTNLRLKVQEQIDNGYLAVG